VNYVSCGLGAQNLNLSTNDPQSVMSFDVLSLEFKAYSRLKIVFRMAFVRPA